MLTLGTIVLALGVSQYQAVALLAREGARWASVHGTEYQATTGKPAATATDVYAQVIAPRGALANPTNLTSSVTWSPNNQPGSTVAVTVKCQWAPQVYLGTVDLSSTAVMTVAY